MSATPIQTTRGESLVAVKRDKIRVWMETRWASSAARDYGFSCERLESVLLEIGNTQNWGVAREAFADENAQVRFLDGLHIEELALARACAAGDDKAWEVFLTRYREVLYGAAYAIAKHETTARELADSLYADLYGMSERDGHRRSKLDSYTGRGSLAGWLRTVLTQRFVDDYRRASRQEQLDEEDADKVPAPSIQESPDMRRLVLMSECVGDALQTLATEDRLLLASYFIDGRTLLEIARLLGVHESTISRRLNHLTKDVRKALLRQLQDKGMRHAEAEEMLGIDVRDVEIDLRSILQAGQLRTFHRVIRPEQ